MSLCNEITIKSFLNTQLPKLADRERGTLVDLGCGRQPYRSLCGGLFKRIIAADLNVRSRIDVRLDVSGLPFKDEAFDVVLFTEVIEHVHESTRAISEIRRVLKKEGRVLITWPFMYPLHELPHDYIRYSEFGMQYLLESAGLRIEVLSRRGDVVCVGLAIVEQFAFNLLELLSRLPIIGQFLFEPSKPWFHKLAAGLWRSLLFLSGSARRFQPSGVGADLKGFVNHLGHWTLGYCALVRKV